MAESPVIEHARRIQRGFGIAGGWVAQKATGVRGYRYAAEQETHAAQLRETEISLSMMSSASADPEQTRMATDIEHGAESRLAVLLAKPILTREEKRERDAIQAALAERRRAFDPAPAPSRIRAFLPPVAAGGPLVALLSSPLTWVAVAFAVPATVATVQTARLNHVKAELTERTEERDQAVAERDGWKERADAYATAVSDAREIAARAAEALERNRRIEARRASEERRRQREIQNVLSGSPEPPAWSLRDTEPVQE